MKNLTPFVAAASLSLLAGFMPGAVRADGPMRIKIEDSTYSSMEQAESDQSAKAAAYVAKMSALTDKPYGTVFMVVANAKPVALNLPGQGNEQLGRMFSLFDRLGYSADADALKQVNLFSEVRFVRADDVAADDFHDSDFKIYLAPADSPGAKAQWMLAKEGGAKTPLSTAPGGMVKAATLQNWVEAVRAGLEVLAPRETQ